MLAARAEDRTPATNTDFFERRFAFDTGLFVSAVDRKFVLEGSGTTVGILIIAEGSTAAFDRFSENLLDACQQTLFFFATEACNGAFGMDSGEKERFVGIDIPQAG